MVEEPQEWQDYPTRLQATGRMAASGLPVANNHLTFLSAGSVSSSAKDPAESVSEVFEFYGEGGHIEKPFSWETAGQRQSYRSVKFAVRSFAKVWSTI